MGTHHYYLKTSMRIQSATLRTTLSKPSTSTRLAPAARTTFLASATTLKSRTSTTPISNNTHRIILGKQSLFHTQTRNMASATSFYDFKPLDKKRQPRPAFHLRQQSRPNRQHCLQMRLHTTIRRSRKNLQIHQRHAPGPIHHPRLPLQPIRLPRTRLRRHDPGILPAELRSQFPDHGKDGCEWR